MLNSKERHYRVALALVPGIGSAWMKKLLAQFGSAQAVFETVQKEKILLPPSIAHKITRTPNFSQAEKILLTHEAQKIQLLFLEEEAYPKRLLELPDPPFILYYKGESIWNTKYVVSIVGTRQLTSYGQSCITKFLEQLQPYRPLVVSGLAYGADIWAHKQALERGIATLAVLPTGLNTIYPRIHTQIALQIYRSKGALVSEYPIGSKIGTYSFVARNRIIAGLADVTIVIEAKEKSGALITAYYANSYHREVFALPGSIYSGTSAGCHQLIKRNQAYLLTDIKDVAYIMGWIAKTNEKTPPKKEIYANYPLTPSEHMILQQLQHASEPLSMDTLLVSASLPIGELQAALLSLELQGLLRVLPGKRFTLSTSQLV